MNESKTHNINKKTRKLIYSIIIFFIIVLILFTISFFLPYYELHYYYYCWDITCYQYSLGVEYLIYGGWEGLILLLISTILLGKSKIRFALILGIIGNILIGMNLYLIQNTIKWQYRLGDWEFGLGFHLGYLVWISSWFLIFVLFVFYELEKCKTTMFSKKGSVNNKTVLIMTLLRTTYPIFSFIFLLSIFFPYYYEISGFLLLIYGGWLGIITIIISVVFLYSYRIYSSYLLGFCGCVFIGFNLLIYIIINAFDLISIMNVGAFGIGFYMGFISWIVFMSINMLSYKFKDELMLF